MSNFLQRNSLEKILITSIIILWLFFGLLKTTLAETTGSTNYTIEQGAFSSGGEPSMESSSYGLQGTVSPPPAGSGESTNYQNQSGLIPESESNEPTPDDSDDEENNGGNYSALGGRRNAFPVFYFNESTSTTFFKIVESVRSYLSFDKPVSNQTDNSQIQNISNEDTNVVSNTENTSQPEIETSPTKSNYIKTRLLISSLLVVLFFLIRFFL